MLWLWDILTNRTQMLDWPPWWGAVPDNTAVEIRNGRWVLPGPYFFWLGAEGER